MKMLVGIGYDIHCLTKKRKLMLGGVEIPFNKGLLGHSDGDALIHSICDAILGALGQGDIGKHFPDTDKKYKGISSLILLEKVKKLCRKAGYKINNLDSVVIAENPKLSSYIKRMEMKIAKILKVNKKYINVKATTNEGLGPVGTGKGIAAFSIVSIVSK